MAAPLTILSLCCLLLSAAAADEAPASLRDTGLPAAGGRLIVVGFAPQYPLWSDGATKRRWLYLPPGTAIDASDPDAWVFPPGTKLWKEFAHGDPVETRLIERLADGSWRYVAYAWEDGEARLAPAAGLRGWPVAAAPGGRYDVPSQDDCRACHEGAAVPVLGLSALQLSPLRDSLAPHAELPGPGDLDLVGLVGRGLVVNLPTAALGARIDAASATSRAALGYLHANCGHCHNERSSVTDRPLVLAQGARTGAQRVLETLDGVPSEFRLPGAGLRLVPGNPDASVLIRRMRSRHPVAQMPPLGTRQADQAGLALLEAWVSLDPDYREVAHHD